MGTDWRDNDSAVEPIVEIYQGDRNNYEHQGAPRSATRETQIGGFEPAGFVWNALSKGYKLGFQASSDHISTHISYAVVLVEEPTRQGILDAFKQRHCYGATDNIIAIVSCQDHLMGDEFTTSKKPTLEINAFGTQPIARVSVVKDMKYVYTTGPNKRQVKFRWTDNQPTVGKTSFYYVRIDQQDGQIAWASPMWITYQPNPAR